MLPSWFDYEREMYERIEGLERILESIRVREVIIHECIYDAHQWEAS